MESTGKKDLSSSEKKQDESQENKERQQAQPSTEGTVSERILLEVFVLTLTQLAGHGIVVLFHVGYIFSCQTVASAFISWRPEVWLVVYLIHV